MKENRRESKDISIRIFAYENKTFLAKKDLLKKKLFLTEEKREKKSDTR